MAEKTESEWETTVLELDGSKIEVSEPVLEDNEEPYPDADWEPAVNLHDLDARRTLVEEGRRAGKQSSKVATRRLAPAAARSYLDGRIDAIVATWITKSWFLDLWSDWLRDRDREEVLVGLGFESSATESLRESIEGRIISTEDEIRRTVRRIRES